MLHIPPAQIAEVGDMKSIIIDFLHKKYPSEQFVVSVYKNKEKVLLELYSMSIEGNKIIESWHLYAIESHKNIIPIDALSATRGTKRGQAVWRLQGESSLGTGDFELDYSFNWVPHPKAIS